MTGVEQDNEWPKLYWKKLLKKSNNSQWVTTFIIFNRKYNITANFLLCCSFSKTLLACFFDLFIIFIANVYISLNATSAVLSIYICLARTSPSRTLLPQIPNVYLCSSCSCTNLIHFKLVAAACWSAKVSIFIIIICGVCCAVFLAFLMVFFVIFMLWL